MPGTVKIIFSKCIPRRGGAKGDTPEDYFRITFRQKYFFRGNGINIPFKESSKSVTPRLVPQGVTDFKNLSFL